ncbi:MAG: hypothetical protein U0T84_00550 [Chitinophagales bacterium]
MKRIITILFLLLVVKSTCFAVDWFAGVPLAKGAAVQHAADRSGSIADMIWLVEEDSENDDSGEMLISDFTPQHPDLLHLPTDADINGTFFKSACTDKCGTPPLYLLFKSMKICG